MKKTIAFIITLLAAISICTSAFAAEAPIKNAPFLESIEFSNAEIDGGFRQDKTLYSLTLKDPNQSAVLSGYKVSGKADVFATYLYDNSNHQTGITVSLNFENGSVIYTFNYSNVQNYAVSSNADLKALNCEYAEVQPEINKNDTVYKVYIPSDLTELCITPVTDDVNAFAAPINLTLRAGQETDFSSTVTASDGTTKKYTFKIKRVNKTVEDVKAEMAEPGYTSFVTGELFYQKPIFTVSVCAVAGGLAAVLIILLIIKRIAVNPYDSDEKPFYSPVE